MIVFFLKKIGITWKTVACVHSQQITDVLSCFQLFLLVTFTTTEASTHLCKHSFHLAWERFSPERRKLWWICITLYTFLILWTHVVHVFISISLLSKLKLCCMNLRRENVYVRLWPCDTFMNNLQKSFLLYTLFLDIHDIFPCLKLS